MAKIVFSGLVMLWRLAVCPTRISPLSVKATIDGVVRAPSEFSMTFALFPSMTATHELVVPRSMPIALAMTGRLLVAGEQGAVDVSSLHDGAPRCSERGRAPSVEE